MTIKGSLYSVTIEICINCRFLHLFYKSQQHQITLIMIFRLMLYVEINVKIMVKICLNTIVYRYSQKRGFYPNDLE